MQDANDKQREGGGRERGGGDGKNNPAKTQTREKREGGQETKQRQKPAHDPKTRPGGGGKESHEVDVQHEGVGADHPRRRAGRAIKT